MTNWTQTRLFSYLKHTATMEYCIMDMNAMLRSSMNKGRDVACASSEAVSSDRLDTPGLRDWKRSLKWVK